MSEVVATASFSDDDLRRSIPSEAAVRASCNDLSHCSDDDDGVCLDSGSNNQLEPIPLNREPEPVAPRRRQRSLKNLPEPDYERMRNLTMGQKKSAGRLGLEQYVAKGAAELYAESLKNRQTLAIVEAQRFADDEWGTVFGYFVGAITAGASAVLIEYPDKRDPDPELVLFLMSRGIRVNRDAIPVNMEPVNIAHLDPTCRRRVRVMISVAPLLTSPR